MSIVVVSDGLTLMCDGCRAVLVGLTASRTCWPVVTAVAAEQGWTGAGDDDGPHHCPMCVRPPAPPALRQWGRLQADIGASGDLVVLTLAGDLDARAAGALRTLTRSAAVARRHTIVDLEAVRFIDSVGLGVLVGARDAQAADGGSLLLAAPSRFVRTVLCTMHLEAVFTVFPDTTAAIVWLADSEGSKPPTADRLHPGAGA